MSSSLPRTFIEENKEKEKESNKKEINLVPSNFFFKQEIVSSFFLLQNSFKSKSNRMFEVSLGAQSSIEPGIKARAQSWAYTMKYLSLGLYPRLVKAWLGATQKALEKFD
jgi:hypothetical protein